MVLDTALGVLVPSWWEVQLTLAAVVFVFVSYWFFAIGSGGYGLGGDDRASMEGFAGGADMNDEKDKFCTSSVDGPI